MKKRTIIGLAVVAAAVATMFAAPSVASAHDKPQYTTVLWLIPDDRKGPNDQDQPYVRSIPGADIQGIKQYAECDKRYQIDVYRPLADGTKPDTLWADGFLRPNHDGGFLAYDLPYTPYEVFTTEPCPIVPPVVTPEPSPPVVTPTPVPPVFVPEVPSSPVTPTPQTPVTEPISPSTPTSLESNTAPSTRPTAPVSPSVVPGVAPSQRIAPVPTPIRTEAKFTG